MVSAYPGMPLSLRCFLRASLLFYSRTPSALMNPPSSEPFPCRSREVWAVALQLSPVTAWLRALLWSLWAL